MLALDALCDLHSVYLLQRLPVRSNMTLSDARQCHKSNNSPTHACMHASRRRQLARALTASSPDAWGMADEFSKSRSIWMVNQSALLLRIVV